MTIREAPQESRGRVLRLGPKRLKLEKETTLMEVRWTRVASSEGTFVKRGDRTSKYVGHGLVVHLVAAVEDVARQA